MVLTHHAVLYWKLSAAFKHTESPQNTVCHSYYLRKEATEGVDSSHMQQSTNANQYQQDGELLVILNMARWTDTGMRYRSVQVCTCEHISLEYIEDYLHQA